ncbi:MAG: copper amine oxidase N-terminal domain-containing protein [Clostridia bacterium]|nr:copper amine oxidase N-terminal domain-containing protein [Clostridia bacterium]
MVKRFFLLLMALACSMSVGVFAADIVETEAEQAVRLRKADVIFLQIDNYATVSDGTLKWIDRGNMAVKPYIKDDRTMVPLRFITEELGATVTYDPATRGISITLGETVMELTVDEKTYNLNGVTYEMDCAAEILEDRTFVPVRFVSVALGRAVEWLQQERIVVITPADALWEFGNSAESAVLAEVRLSLSPLGRNKIQ